MHFKFYQRKQPSLLFMIIYAMLYYNIIIIINNKIYNDPCSFGFFRKNIIFNLVLLKC